MFLAMLQKVLDPPDPETVEEALDFLVHIRALEQTFSHRARYEPTFYGRLLDSLPLSFDASVLALRFGEIGLLQQGILISILMDIQPSPILQPFGNPDLVSPHPVLSMISLHAFFLTLSYHLCFTVHKVCKQLLRCQLQQYFRSHQERNCANWQPVCISILAACF